MAFKHLKYLEKFEDINKYNKIYEENPFENDMRFGDTLLGRLINSTIRKIKIGANIARMKIVNERLKLAFDGILLDSDIESMADEDRKKMSLITLYKIIEEIDKKVKQLEIDNNDNKKDITTKLNEFKSLLDEYEEKNSNTQPNNIEIKEKFAKNVSTIISNISSISKIVSNNDNTTPNNIKSNSNNISINNIDNTTPNNIKSNSNNISINNIDNTNTNTKTPSSESFKYKSYERMFEDANPTTDNIINATSSTINTTMNNNNNNNNNNTSTTSTINSVDDNTNTNNGNNINNKTPEQKAYDKLKNAFKQAGWLNDNLKLSNGLSVTETMKIIDSYADKTDEHIMMNKEDTNYTYNSAMIVIGRQVSKNFAIYGIDDKIYESNSYVTLFTNDVPKAISLVLKEIRGLNKKPELLSKLTNISQYVTDISDASEDMTNDLSKIDDIIEKEKDNKEKQNKNEHLITDYNTYIRLYEADENNTTADNKVINNEDDEISDPIEKDYFDKVIDKWRKEFDMKQFVIDETEVDKLNKKLDAIDEDADNVTVLHRDHIIDVIKVFNRAYKLHTTQVIPTNRSHGRVSNKTFMEYTSFGGGTPNNAGESGGPYRNNAIFNQFENCVLNIEKDKKYQKIFRNSTVLKTDDDKIIPKAGTNLIKFMNDMLDGETLYRTSNRDKGSQTAFLEKYFGINADNKDLAFGGQKEVENNSKISKSIKTTTFKSNKKINDDGVYKNMKPSELIGTFIAAECKLSNKSNTQYENNKIYMFIQAMDNDYAYVVYCKTFYFFDKYILESGMMVNKNGDNGNIILSSMIDKSQYALKATKIPINYLFDKTKGIALNDTYKIAYLTRYNDGKNEYNVESKIYKDDNIDTMSEIRNICVLCYDKEDKSQDKSEEYNIFKLKNNKAIKEVGGFDSISTTQYIQNAITTK